MKTLLSFLVLWLMPWGLGAIALFLSGRPAAGLVLGVGSFFGMAFVVGLMAAAKGN